MIPATLLGMVMVAAPAEAAVANTSKMAGDVVFLTNKQRAAHGCKAVKADARLNQAAKFHSAWMAQTGTFSHVGRGGSAFDQRIRAAGYRTPRSENIAFGYQTGADVVKAWMNSPGHRANILDCTAKTVGVAIVFSKGGTPYITQDFGM
jgi:uncharacterized protein YkwD